MTTHRWEGWASWAVAVAVMCAIPVPAAAKTKLTQALTATAHAPRASGTAKLVLKNRSSGRFSVRAKHLRGNASFDVVVDGVKVGALVTGPRGGGIARFDSAPRGHGGRLGFDPRGAHVAVRESDTGEDDLDGDMPDDHPDSAIACCVGDHDEDDHAGEHDRRHHDDHEAECELKTADACTAHGGTPMTATSCLPDPCGTNPPPATVVCCRTSSAGGAFVDDDREVDCEDDMSQAACVEHGGMVVQAPSCDPNPCQPTPPPDVVVCCVPDGDETECEHVTRQHCSDAGGTVSTATSCENHPCGGGEGGDGGDGEDHGGHQGDGGGDDQGRG
jgi:hypothetical protein